MSNLNNKQYLQHMVRTDPDALLTEVTIVFSYFLVGVPKIEHLASPYPKELVYGPAERISNESLIGYSVSKDITRPNYFCDFAHALNNVRDALAIPTDDKEIFPRSQNSMHPLASEISDVQYDIHDLLLQMLGSRAFEPLFIYANTLQVCPEAKPHIPEDQQRRISQCLNYFLNHYCFEQCPQNNIDREYLAFLEDRQNLQSMQSYIESWKQRQ